MDALLVFTFKSQTLGLSNLNQGRKDHTAAVDLPHCLCFPELGMLITTYRET